MINTGKIHPAYLAWKTAWRIRCCPPDILLYGENTQELQAHLLHCPWCREERKHQLNENFSFPAVDISEKTKETPSPGELWSLKQELGGWGPKNRYYTPPLVVIIKVYKDSVEVCQSFDDCALAGVDDVQFESPWTGFCQPWNRYSLRRKDLARNYGTVFSSITSIINSSPKQLIETGSLLWFFRQMEVETGFFFSSRAVTTLMARYEDDVRKTAEQIADMGLPLPPQLPETVDELFFAIEIPDSHLPLAAADGKEITSYCLNLFFENDILRDFQTTDLNIIHWHREGPLLHVSGHFSNPLPENSTILCRFKVKNHFFTPIPGEFGAEGDLFWALFQVDETDIEQGECIVRIITKRA